MSLKALSAVGSVLLLGVAACSNSAQPPTEKGDGTATTKLTIPAGVYKIDPTHAVLQWKVSHFGTSDYHARFTKVDGEINLQPENIEQSTVKFVVQADSIDTDYPGDYKKTHASSGFDSWDAELGRSDKFMDGVKNPQILFKSTKVEKTGDNTGRVTGDLSFRGITKPITLNVRFIGQNPKHFMTGVPVVGFEAEGDIVRADFGMAKDALGAVAKVYFNGEFHGSKPGQGTGG